MKNNMSNEVIDKNLENMTDEELSDIQSECYRILHRRKDEKYVGKFLKRDDEYVYLAELDEILSGVSFYKNRCNLFKLTRNIYGGDWESYEEITKDEFIKSLETHKNYQIKKNNEQIEQNKLTVEEIQNVIDELK